MKTNTYTLFAKTILLGVFVLALAYGDTAKRGSEEEQDDTPRIVNVDDYREPWITGDTNQDGRVDYALKLNDEGRKDREAVDHNNDGRMDNFYYYRNGALARQEIDTNHDGNIDLWIRMYDGVRVGGYRRDTNHDGEVDLVRNFEED